MDFEGFEGFQRLSRGFKGFKGFKVSRFFKVFQGFKVQGSGLYLTLWKVNRDGGRGPKKGQNVTGVKPHLFKITQNRCSDDLFLAQIATLFSRFVRVQLFYTRQ